MLKKIAALTIIALSGILLQSPAEASHSWNGYHWARTNNPFPISLGDNVSGSWDSELRVASSNWSVSTVLDTHVVQGWSNRSCKPIVGRVEVCNAKYGRNGWLGVATVWISGDHIIQGTVKLNDSYQMSSAEKQLVVCQEIGHTLGLDHQDEVFDNANLNTCMDYTSSPESNQHPNQHDYDELEFIYNHVDSTNTAFASTTSSSSGALDVGWGIKASDHLYIKDLGHGNKAYTFVVSV